ncbi:MAG TPA: TorF family putative porin [Pseudomonadales bacterium]
MNEQRRPVLASVLAAFALLGGFGTAQGAEISGNVTLASDYSFRGVSQTSRDPAIQGGFDVAWASGFYVGTWSSNVSFGVTSQEWDLYFGYGGAINDKLSWDVNYVRFEYPSAGSELDYNELDASLSFANFTAGLGYSNEYFALDDVTWFYPYIEYSQAMPSGASLDFHIGVSLVDDNSADDFTASFGDDRVVDWSVTYTIPVSGVDIGIGVVGTDVDDEDCFGGSEDCSTRAIVSLSKSL